MKISDIFRSRNLNETGQTGSQVGSSTEKNNSNRSRDDGQDKVSISPLARQFAQVSGILKDDDAVRLEKITRIKSQVQDGSYSVSSDGVAKAILDYQK